MKAHFETWWMYRTWQTTLLQQDKGQVWHVFLSLNELTWLSRIWSRNCCFKGTHTRMNAVGITLSLNVLYHASFITGLSSLFFFTSILRKKKSVIQPCYYACANKKEMDIFHSTISPDSPFVPLYIRLTRSQQLGLHVCMYCPCLGFSRWNHGMEVISHPIPLWTVIRCRQCAMDPKGLPSAYFHSFLRWEISNHHLVNFFGHTHWQVTGTHVDIVEK